ncbi:hypothetical protein BDV96DRAFT_562051 [Lophiotrema nucula]|uniref:Secreted protein n=1 Tax=Lophiotrema nucula TaxID=690887 RepID=A0A6A5ZWM4_9PLEO|nr:hypothetical protein BDV96DRAFT_562051 [Lophiotrema nucula]
MRSPRSLTLCRWLAGSGCLSAVLECVRVFAAISCGRGHPAPQGYHLSPRRPPRCAPSAVMGFDYSRPATAI